MGWLKGDAVVPGDAGASFEGLSPWLFAGGRSLTRDREFLAGWRVVDGRPVPGAGRIELVAREVGMTDVELASFMSSGFAGWLTGSDEVSPARWLVDGGRVDDVVAAVSRWRAL